MEFQQLSGKSFSTQSITYAVQQDSLGNLWVASEEGVLKHDSKDFQVYNSYQGLPENISNRTVALCVDSHNDIWIGSERGVSFLNKNRDQFELITSGNLQPTLVKIIEEGNDGNMYVGGYNGLWRIENKNKKFKTERIVKDINVQTIEFYKDFILLGTSKGLYSYHIYTRKLQSISLQSKNQNITFVGGFEDFILVGTKTGLILQLDAQFSKISEINLLQDIQIPINDIIQDDLHNFYVGTDGKGLYYLDKDFEIIDHYQDNQDSKNSLSSNGIYDLELGQENILWIATYGGGINYNDANQELFTKIQHKIRDKNSIVENFTRAIAKDRNGNIWFGTRQGISVWNKKNNNWYHFENFNDSDFPDIILSLESDNNLMWVGTYNHGVYAVDINTLKVEKDVPVINLKSVFNIFKDNSNNIWFGGIDGNLIQMSSKGDVKSFPIQQIKYITESKKTGLIYAAGRYGVFKIDPIKNEFENISQIQSNQKELSYSNINHLEIDEDERLIIATNGAGLIIYDQATNKISRLNINSGLPSDIIQSIIIEEKNNYWLGTARGLAHTILKANDTIINVFDKQDGLASTEFNYGSVAKLNKNLYAFGGTGGVTIFNPSEVKDKNYTPDLVFDEFSLFNKVIQPEEEPLEKHINETKSIHLKHNQNSVEFKFTGISFSTPSKIKYSWKLEGFDKNWSKPTETNFANYTNLSPGEYSFKVKAYNKYGILRSYRDIGLIISSPWWATTQAYVIYCMIVILLIWLIIHVTSVIVNKKNADEQIHFFNSITHEIKTPLAVLMSSLNNFSNQDEDSEKINKRIKTTVKRINSLFEQILNFHRISAHRKSNIRIAKIDIYAHLEKLIADFEPLLEEQNLKVKFYNNWGNKHFYYDREVLDKAVMNLLSNAIKYSNVNNIITVELHKSMSKDLIIKVIDNGIGIPKEQQKFILKKYYRARNVINSQRPGTGLGLVMVKRLLEKTGGTISFKSKEGEGTVFNLQLKNHKAKYKLKKEHKNVVAKATIKEPNEKELEKKSLDRKVLVVEDNDELRLSLVSSLKTYFEVIEAENGKIGLEKAAEHYPDIILTDLIMPEMDGMEMAQALKKDIGLNHIPVFMLTVLQNSDQKIESIESGVAEYIEKPVNFEFLLAKISNTLQWQEQLRQKYIQEGDATILDNHRNEHQKEFLQDLEATVIENIENNSFSVHDLAGAMGMSRTSLYMKLKNLVDLSAKDYIIHTRLKFAKQLLIEESISIKEVAYRSGFSNPKYFSTSFKKFYGKSPSRYLEELKKH